MQRKTAGVIRTAGAVHVRRVGVVVTVVRGAIAGIRSRNANQEQHGNNSERRQTCAAASAKNHGTVSDEHSPCCLLAAHSNWLLGPAPQQSLGGRFIIASVRLFAKLQMCRHAA